MPKRVARSSVCRRRIQMTGPASSRRPIYRSSRAGTWLASPMPLLTFDQRPRWRITSRGPSVAAPLDKLFGVHAQALVARKQQLELLSANIANADTPHYKARAVDFQQLLGELSSTSNVSLQAHLPEHYGRARGRDGQISMQNDSHAMASAVRFRTATQPSLDGNTVDMQREQADFAQNSVRYLTSLKFLNDRISGLVRVLKGD